MRQVPSVSKLLLLGIFLLFGGNVAPSFVLASNESGQPNSLSPAYVLRFSGISPRVDREARGLAQYILGVRSEVLDNLDESIAHYEQSVQSDPENYIVHLRLGSNYARANRFPEAIASLNRASELNSADVQAHYLLALIYSALKEYDKSAMEYEKILQTFAANNPQNVEIYGYLGQLYYLQKNIDKAIVQFQKILSFEPKNADVIYMLGTLYEDKNDRAAAINYFKQAIAIDPEHDGCLNSLGYLYALEGSDLAEAQALVERAIKINPTSGAYFDSLGWIYYKQQKYDQALTYLLKANSLISDPVIYDHLGDVYLKLNQPENAKRYWLLSLELSPENQLVLDKINALKLDQQQASLPIEAANP